MKKTAFITVICVGVILTLVLVLFLYIGRNNQNSSSDIFVKSEVIAAAKDAANKYSISKRTEHIEVKLDSILATKEALFIWIFVDGIPNNKVYDYLDECIITDQMSNVWTYSYQEKDISSYGKYSIRKPQTNITGLAENELIIKFITGMKSDSTIQIYFDFGKKGSVTFDDIHVDIADTTVCEVGDDSSLEFDLPYAHCKIMEVEYSPLGVFLTIRWELEEGFTTSTKNDYPQYHTKFTFGEKSRFTFLLLPEHWSSDDSVIFSTYHLEELIPIGEMIKVDLYLNDDETFERNLVSIHVK